MLLEGDQSPIFNHKQFRLLLFKLTLSGVNLSILLVKQLGLFVQILPRAERISSRIPVALFPTLNEQKAIASLLEKWDTAIEKTEALIEAKEKRFKWLLKTLISDQQDNPEWRQVKLGEICTFEYGKLPLLKEKDRNSIDQNKLYPRVWIKCLLQTT